MFFPPTLSLSLKLSHYSTILCADRRVSGSLFCNILSSTTWKFHSHPHLTFNLSIMVVEVKLKHFSCNKLWTALSFWTLTVTRFNQISLEIKITFILFLLMAAQDHRNLFPGKVHFQSENLICELDFWCWLYWIGLLLVTILKINCG